MTRTAIEWTDETWNPVTGCSKVSPGCENCYAERQAVGRLKGKKGYPGLPWTKVNASTNVVLHPDRLEIPLRATRPRMYFVNSMSDLFHEKVPNEFIAAIFGVMAATPRHAYQILTKRTERMAEWFRWVVEQDAGLDGHTPGRLECCWQALAHEVKHHKKGAGGPLHMDHAADPEGPWPLPNVWLGVSTEDQKRADERIPLLLQTPAAVRFVSAEPLLGAIDFRQQWVDYLEGWYTETESGHDCDGTEEVCMRRCPVPVPVQAESHALDWVIVGGESGPRRRPMDLDWARSIRDQCRAAVVPFFMKQVDKVIPVPSDLAIREMPRG